MCIRTDEYKKVNFSTKDPETITPLLLYITLMKKNISHDADDITIAVMVKVINYNPDFDMRKGRRILPEAKVWLH